VLSPLSDLFRQLPVLALLNLDFCNNLYRQKKSSNIIPFILSNIFIAYIYLHNSWQPAFFFNDPQNKLGSQKQLYKLSISYHKSIIISSHSFLLYVILLSPLCHINITLNPLLSAILILIACF
jgi:hypothetical protein